MAPQKPDAKDHASAAKNLKASTGAGVAKRQYKKVRFLENGLLYVDRKTGKYLKM
jgi:FKBP-type peptidyl-prolyl cis-trans isomerase